MSLIIKTRIKPLILIIAILLMLTPISTASFTPMGATLPLFQEKKTIQQTDGTEY